MANVVKQSTSSQGPNQFSQIKSDIAHKADDLKTQLQSWVPEQANISEVERTVSGVVGSALGALAVERFFNAKYLSGSLALLGASALLMRGISGKCPAYKAMDRDTSSDCSSKKQAKSEVKNIQDSDSLDGPTRNRTGAKSSQVKSSAAPSPDQNRRV